MTTRALLAVVGVFALCALPLSGDDAPENADEHGLRLEPPTIVAPSGRRVERDDEPAREKRAQIDPEEIWFASRHSLRPDEGIDSEVRLPLRGVYVVQFRGPILKEWREALEAAGARILDYVQNYAYIIEVPEASSNDVVALAQGGLLRYLGPYPAEAKISWGLQQAVESRPPEEGIEITVCFFDVLTKAQKEAVTDILAVTKWEDDPVMPFARGAVEPGKLQQIAELPFVKWVEEYVPGKLGNIESSMSGGADQVAGGGAYDGTGVRVAVDDSGIARTGNSTQCGAGGAAYHPDINSGRIADQWDFHYGDSNPCDDNGHGTHVAGTIGGDGTNTSAWTGIAPGVTYLIYKDCSAGGIGFGNFTSVLSRAASNDANVVACSWGGGNGVYNSRSVAADNAVRGEWDGSDAKSQYMNISVCSQNDTSLCTSPATGKNVIGVGATKDGNNAGGSDFWPPTEIASFSNFGPVDTDGDGKTRIKPDVVAPGTSTMSTAATHLTGTIYTGGSGTSMAQPTVAGTMALMLDKYPGYEDWPEIIKARILATAVNMGSTDNFGHGMVDALHAIYSTSSLDMVRWAGGYITDTSDEDEHSFTVPAGYEEVRVYLTWSDPPSLVTEVVNDLDLRVYDGTDTLVGASLSYDDTVEYVRLTSGVAGSWRAVVRGENVTEPEPDQKYGIIAVVVLNAPSRSLSASASDTCLRPNQTFSISTTHSNSGYSVVGSQTQMDLPNNTSLFSFLDVNMTTEDPGRGHTYLESELWRDVVLNRYYLGTGIVNQSIPRSATWNLQVGSGTPNGSYNFYVYASATGESNLSKTVTVTVDGTEPGAVTGLVSSDHTIGECSNDMTVMMTWAAAQDGGGCGIDGYGISWTKGAQDIPAAIKDIEEVTTYTGTLVASALPYYFNIRSVDNAGNWDADYVSWGPFYLDDVAPANATNLDSINHTLNECSTNLSVTMTWTAATDAHCGVDGYGISWSTAPVLPPAVKDIEDVTTYTETLAASEFPYYFNIRSVDNAGNWDTDYVSWGPFYLGEVDATWTSNEPVCVGDPVNFDAPSGSDFYEWDFGENCNYGVVINEVNVGSPAYVELYNSGSTDVDLEDWEFAWTDTLPTSGSFLVATTFILGPGKYVQIVDGPGVDDATHIYIGEAITWDETRGGSAALNDINGKCVDFVRWGGDVTSPPPGTSWGEASVLTSPRNVGESLSRDDSSTDRDSSEDWCIQAPTNAAPAEPVQNSNCPDVFECAGAGCRYTVIINEVNVGEPASVELYNSGSMSVDLQGWMLFWTDTLPASGFYVLPSFELHPGAYVQLVNNTNPDDATHIYLGSGITWFYPRGGSAALLDDAGIGVDFVRWEGDMTTPPGGTSWVEPSVLPSPLDDGESLSRDDSSTDKNSSDDWCLQVSTNDVMLEPVQNLDCPAVEECLQGGCSYGVRINEVGVGTSYVELYNSGSTTVDLDDWELAWTDTLPDSGSFLLPVFLLAPGAYVQLVEGSGSNNSTHIYLGDSIAWDESRGGSASLSDENAVGVDFVRWKWDVTPPPSGTAWVEVSVLPTPANVGESLSRDDSSADRNSSEDWCIASPSDPAGDEPYQNPGCPLVPDCPSNGIEDPSYLYDDPGTYIVTLTVADTIGCTDTHSASVTVGEYPATNIQPDGPVICPGDSQVLDANPWGGTPPYTFLWSPGGTQTQTINVSPAVTTAYSVTVTDAIGCAAGSNETVTVNPSPATTIAETCGDPTSVLDADPSDGTPPYTFLWSTGATTQTISVPCSTGLYSVTVTDAAGCSGTSPIFNTCPCSGQLPEPNPITGSPLEALNKDGDLWLVEMVAGATQYNVYTNPIASFGLPSADDKYDNGAVVGTTCFLQVGPALDVQDNGDGTADMNYPLADNAWFLITAASSAAGSESTVGFDSAAIERSTVGTWAPMCGP
jgi:subtilisin family serine protease